MKENRREMDDEGKQYQKGKEKTLLKKKPENAGERLVRKGPKLYQT